MDAEAASGTHQSLSALSAIWPYLRFVFSTARSFVWVTYLLANSFNKRLWTRHYASASQFANYKWRSQKTQTWLRCLWSVVGKICERGRFLPEVKERGSYGWWELSVDRVRRCGRWMNRQVRYIWLHIGVSKQLLGATTPMCLSFIDSQQSELVENREPFLPRMCLIFDDRTKVAMVWEYWIPGLPSSVDWFIMRPAVSIQ